MSRQSTQSDVARLAGVSTATVSRVLNGRDSVSASVAERVRSAMDTLHYVPHANARSLAMQRSLTLGVLIPSLNNAIFAEGVNAFERAARAHGYAVILCISEASAAHHIDQVNRLIEQNVDGVLLVGNDHAHEVFDRLDKAGVRQVCAWSYDEAARTANVGFDNAMAMHAVVDHLFELGHRKFGMLAGRRYRNDRARDRVSGVVERLNYHGIALEPFRVIEVDYSISASRRAFWDVIDNDLTAVICGNDVIAYGVCLEAARMGLCVPNDLSVTGFDDLELSAELSPGLTTVRVEAAEMGAAAADALVTAIETGQPVHGYRLPTRLVIRETTARVGD